MRKYVLSAIFIATLAGFTMVTFLLSPNSAQAQERKVSSAYLAVIYLAFLKDEGYQPELKGEGKDQVILFKKAGLIYIIELQPEDTTFFRIVLPMFWKIDSVEERLQVLEAANLTNSRVKIAKTMIVNNHLWISSETHIPNPEGFAKAFKRLMEVNEVAQKEFAEQMKALQKKKDN